MKDVIYIDRYETKIVGKTVQYYAVKGKKTYPMPECYSDMYNDDHLAIKEVTMTMPELYDTVNEHYIPLRTAPL